MCTIISLFCSKYASILIGSETGYTHTSRLLAALRLAGLGSILIIGGILILTGIF